MFGSAVSSQKMTKFYWGKTYCSPENFYMGAQRKSPANVLASRIVKQRKAPWPRGPAGVREQRWEECRTDALVFLWSLLFIVMSLFSTHPLYLSIPCIWNHSLGFTWDLIQLWLWRHQILSRFCPHGSAGSPLPASRWVTWWQEVMSSCSYASHELHSKHLG